MKVLAPTDPRVIEICQQQQIDPQLATCAASFGWQDNTDLKEPNANYAAILVDIPEDESGRSGKLLRNQGYVEGIPVICRYQFATDGILTIDTEYEKNQGQERCWFVTDNFRVRVSSVRMMDGINLMTYCSEFRCVESDTLDQMIEQNRALALS